VKERDKIGIFSHGLRERDKIGILSHGVLAWEGDFTGLNSLALVNRAICSRLVARGHDVRQNGHTPAAIHVRHRWPPDLEPPREGRWVLMQPWEYGSLPRSFAAARNAALARARGDYVFWLDADDVVDPPEREKLKRLLSGLRPGEQSAFVVRCSCDPGPDGDGGQTVVDHIRLFPRREGVRWTYAVHEQILPALRRANIPVTWSDVTVRHTGYTLVSELPRRD
jgi:hypothetical protein